MAATISADSFALTKTPANLLQSMLILVVGILLLQSCGSDDDAADASAASIQTLPPVPAGDIDRDRYRDLKRALRDQPKRELSYPADDSGPRYESSQQAADEIVEALAGGDSELADKILALTDPDLRLETFGLLVQHRFDAEARDDYASAYRLRRYLHFDQFAFWRLDTATIRGHVYQAVTRAPVVGAVVKTPYGGTDEARSDKDGSFELVVKSGLPLALLAEHPDHQAYPVNVSTSEGPVEQNFKLMPRSDLVVNIELQPSVPTEPAGPRVAVRGQVIDVDSQQPISDMEISVVPSGNEGLRVLMGGFTALTDADGQFEITDLPVGTHLLVARKANPIYHHTDEQFVVSEDDIPRRIEAKELPAKRISIPIVVDGYVRDRVTGLPIVKAKVSGGTYRSTRTDDEGRFRLELPTGEEWNIQATHEWYHESATQSFSSTKPKRFETEYLLDPITTGTIVGVAIDALTGQPISRATIKIAGQTVTTDSQGRFRLEEIEAGEVAVSGGQDGYRADAQTISLAALKTAETRLVLEPITEGSIGGTVADATTGQVLGGVRVSAAGQQAVTDAAGKFLIEKVEKGDVEVAASKAVYERAAMSVEVVAQEVSTLRIPLTPVTYGTLSGKAVDAATGQPLADASISLASIRLQTDAAGDFVAEKVPAGNVLVVGSYDRYYDGKQTVALEAAGEASVTVSLQLITTGTVRGVVRNASSGTPISGATVSVGRLSTRSDTDGSFVIADVPEGDLTLAADAKLYESNREEAVLDAATEIQIDLQLVPITYGAIAGVVVDASTNKAIAGARVKAGKKTVISDADGAFLLDRITAGDITIDTSKPVYRDDSRPVRLVAGASLDISIELQPITTGTIRGTVRSKDDGRPLAGAEVSVGSLSVSSDNAGTYVLENVAAGNVQLGAALKLFEPASRNITLAPAGDTQANFELTPITYGTIVGTVVDASINRPISGARVAAGGKQTVTDASGKYELDHVSAGSVSITATKAVYIDGSERRELIAGGSLTVKVELQPITWGALKGLVVDAESGAAIRGAEISVAGQKLISDQDGRFSIERITAGTLAMSASKATYKPGSLSMKLAPDGVAEGIIRLDPIKVGAVRVQVLDAKTGSAVTQARVSTGGMSGETDSAGQFSFANVAIGRVAVTARHADYANGGASVGLEGGQVAELTVKLDLRREDVTNLEAALASEGTIDLYGIYFDSGKDHFKPSSLATLRAVLEVMKRAPDRRFQIAGHTDSDGADASNQDLSERRATKVIDWLVDNGVDGGRLDAFGYGEGKPAAPNDTVAGKALNRRVQLSFSN